MEAKSYSNLNNLFNPSPGFATTIFVSWEELSHVFEIDERWDLVKEGDTTPIDVINMAFQEAQVWADKYKESAGSNPSDEDLTETENDIAKAIMDHWSHRAVLSANIDFQSMVDGINLWCKAGPKNKNLFINPPTPQTGLNFILNDLGVSFTIYPSFIVPYTELYYNNYENLPEWNLEDLDGTDIAETLFLYCYSINKPITLELTQWDANREKL